MPNFTQLNMPQPMAVVAHDAGGANQIIALLKAHTGAMNIRAYLQGPALKLWSQSFPESNVCASLEDALSGSQSLLAGTGWASDLEYNAIDLAQSTGLHTAALLDHWTNYEQRFIRDKRAISPSEYWVVDQYALSIAKQTFPQGKLKQIPDFYLQSQIEQIPPPSSCEDNLLYVLEPARSCWGKSQPGEFQALDYMLEKLPLMKLPHGINIRLRPHPSENKGKYQSWIAQQNNANITLDESATLASALSDSKWVAGCESYALTLALASGRTVYCTLPPWAPTCRLPHKGLIQVKSL